MVSAPVSYIGLVIALVLVAAIMVSVWTMVNKLARLPKAQVKVQPLLPSDTEKITEKLPEQP